MTSRCGGRIALVLLVVASMGIASCSSKSESSTKLNPADAGKAADARVKPAPDGAAAGAGGKASSGTTGGSAGSGGSGGAVTVSGGVSGSAGSGGRGGAGAGGTSSVTSASGGSGRGTSGSGGSGGGTSNSGGSSGGNSSSGGSGGGTSGSGGATSPTGGSSGADAAVRDGASTTPDGAARRDGDGRDAGAGRAGADASGGTGGSGGSTVSGTGSDGCTDSQAANLTLQQIAVYQSVKIPTMTDGSEVASASRKNAVVEGRDTTFRVFVTVDSGWTARELSARLTLTPSGGQGTQYYTRKTVSASSTDVSLTTTFQIQVPASAMTDSLRYSVEVVECGSQPGAAGTARFPASDDADLGVKTTGGLKITIVPFQVGTLLPDTSQATLDLYASQMMAMYPINAITFTVSDPIAVSSPVDWTSMLDQVRAKRTKDAPSADTYYFGLVKPAASLRVYCLSTCTAGIGFVVTNANQGSGRAAVGLGFADSESALTMAHEVGHNHGRMHAPCAPKGLTMTGVDSKYPYSGGVLGAWGWDGRSQILFDPAKATDIMGYCSTQWMSDYTYAGITTRVAAVNGGSAHLMLPETSSKWRVLLLDARGPRWGVPIEDEVAAEGEPETATIYDNTGGVLTQVVVYRTEIGDIPASMVWVPEPKPDWYAVEVTGAVPHPFAAPVTVPRP